MNWTEMFFQGWSGLARTLIVGILAYVSLVLFLRVSGKRTLAKLNAFDLVITVALGSTLSAVLLQESIALAEGGLALALLILMQYLVTYASVRWRAFAKAVRSEPTLLASAGQFHSDAMRRERVTEDETLSAIRAAGGRDVGDVAFLVLESDGSLNATLRSRCEANEPQP
jgi:uncharacterized membrane protein YcaP (DUF421 family)